MNKFTSLLKKWWFYLILIILIIGLFLTFRNKTTETLQTTAPVNRKVATFGEISPGKTSVDRVNELLGFPTNSTNLEDKSLLEYRTSNEFRFHEVTAENNTVKLLKEIVNIEDNKNAD